MYEVVGLLFGKQPIQKLPHELLLFTKDFTSKLKTRSFSRYIRIIPVRILKEMKRFRIRRLKIREVIRSNNFFVVDRYKYINIIRISARCKYYYVVAQKRNFHKLGTLFYSFSIRNIGIDRIYRNNFITDFFALTSYPIMNQIVNVLRVVISDASSFVI